MGGDERCCCRHDLLLLTNKVSGCTFQEASLIQANSTGVTPLGWEVNVEHNLVLERGDSWHHSLFIHWQWTLQFKQQLAIVKEDCISYDFIFL